MTSSLVGSEMCIRDRSTWAWPQTQKMYKGSVLQEARELSWAIGAGKAVSYTHLTLPTICSV
eukprot:3053626-Prorocentrum_lima.AAC.1